MGQNRLFQYPLYPLYVSLFIIHEWASHWNKYTVEKTSCVASWNIRLPVLISLICCRYVLWGSSPDGIDVDFSIYICCGILQSLTFLVKWNVLVECMQHLLVWLYMWKYRIIYDDWYSCYFVYIIALKHFSIICQARGVVVGDGVRVHSLSLPGIISRTGIHFSGPGEVSNRKCFQPKS